MVHGTSDWRFLSPFAWPEGELLSTCMLFCMKPPPPAAGPAALKFCGGTGALAQGECGGTGHKLGQACVGPREACERTYIASKLVAATELVGGTAKLVAAEAKLVPTELISSVLHACTHDKAGVRATVREVRECLLATASARAPFSGWRQRREAVLPRFPLAIREFIYNAAAHIVGSTPAYTLWCKRQHTGTAVTKHRIVSSSLAILCCLGAHIAELVSHSDKTREAAHHVDKYSHV